MWYSVFDYYSYSNINSEILQPMREDNRLRVQNTTVRTPRSKMVPGSGYLATLQAAHAQPVIRRR